MQNERERNKEDAKIKRLKEREQMIRIREIKRKRQWKMDRKSG